MPKCTASSGAQWGTGSVTHGADGGNCKKKF